MPREVTQVRGRSSSNGGEYFGEWDVCVRMTPDRYLRPHQLLDEARPGDDPDDQVRESRNPASPVLRTNTATASRTASFGSSINSARRGGARVGRSTVVAVMNCSGDDNASGSGRVRVADVLTRYRGPRPVQPRVCE